MIFCTNPKGRFLRLAIVCGNRYEGPLVEPYSNLEPVRLNLLTVEGSMLEGMPLAGAVNED